MNEFTFYPSSKTNELSGSITKYAIAVDQYMNAGMYEKMLEVFETGLLDRGFRFCHKSADEDQYRINLQSVTKAELGELVMIARARYMSPTEPLSDIRERIYDYRSDGNAFVWVDGFIAALEQKGLYLAHSDNLPPFVQPSTEQLEAPQQQELIVQDGGTRSSWKIWAGVAVVALLLGGLAAAAPTIIDQLKRHDLVVGDWLSDSNLMPQKLPKIEVTAHRAIQYPGSIRDWCNGEEVFCSTTNTGSLKETLRGMISAIPNSDAKQFKVRLAIVPVESYEDSN
ncbi:hypothetical protein LN429_15285 [Pseudomonas syringae]|uniref:hypothetical protein n=1 Tax=Pseudomonas syringae TaxID=317 RepID=UPI00234D5312|nr:hypothetical protein [Pseudomonas syringae]MDC6536466.1 hypothetical protein [Pseudomonas syringae]